MGVYDYFLINAAKPLKNKNTMLTLEKCVAFLHSSVLLISHKKEGIILQR